MISIQFPMIPILIYFSAQYNKVPFVKFEVTRFFPFVGIKSFSIGKLSGVLQQKKEKYYVLLCN